ncbi:integrase [Brevundimonas bullata]|uniref:Integrase n=1 Tax=Brevundimonas bullata TaxID=13160 RepID=A0A7W7IRC3_9CAUL|nr:site-specific integrase [Brevundimonas bullata]MBB4798615.1 integrase [Brevundimonas bullata]MBB6383070.1 integrase [Brevundimonas bullata]
MEAVPGCNHLYRRGAVYWFRRRVPGDVAKSLGTSQWRLSLGTKDFDEAKRLARLRSVSTDQQITVVRARNMGKVSPPLSKQEAEKLAQSWIADVLEWDEAFRLGRPGEIKSAALWLEEEAANYRETLGTLDTAAVAQEVAETLAKAGLWYPSGDPSRNQIALALLKARVRLVELMERRLGGEVVEVATPVIMSPAPSLPVGMTVAELVAAFRAERVARHGEESTDRKYSHIFSGLEEALGNSKPIRSITRADIREVRTLLQRVPKFATRRYPGLTLSEAAERADEDGGERIAPTTVNTYLQNLAAVFNWAVGEELLDRNPAQGMALSASPNVQRRGFTTEELQRLFNGMAPLAEGEQPWRFWIPALALFSGARAGELAALRKADFVIIDGVQCMRFTKFDDRGRRIEGRSLKTEASARTVPIHRAVLDAGLMDYVATLADHSGLAFPSLQPGPDGKASHYLSKWFGDFRQDMGVGDPATPFHSFRHGFRDATREAGIPGEIADMLGGWTTQGIATQYGNKGRVALLSRELAKVSYAPFTLPLPAPPRTPLDALPKDRRT